MSKHNFIVVLVWKFVWLIIEQSFDTIMNYQLFFLVMSSLNRQEFINNLWLINTSSLIALWLFVGACSLRLSHTVQILFISIHILSVLHWVKRLWAFKVQLFRWWVITFSKILSWTDNFLRFIRFFSYWVWCVCIR